MRDNAPDLETKMIRPLSQGNCLSGVHKARMFNHHPACACGFRRAIHNFAKPGQLEFEDLVIASPSQVETQSAWGNVFVYAHNERCVLDSFHLSNFMFFCFSQRPGLTLPRPIVTGLLSSSQTRLRVAYELLKLEITFNSRNSSLQSGHDVCSFSQP
jgi:hypothetical protein